MSEGDVERVREMLDLFTSNERDAAWDMFADDAVLIPVPDWPERLKLLRCEGAGEGRVFVAMQLETETLGSGIPLNQPLQALYFLRDGEIVRAHYFNDLAEAERAAEAA